MTHLQLKTHNFSNQHIKPSISLTSKLIHFTAQIYFQNRNDEIHQTKKATRLRTDKHKNKQTEISLVQTI